MRRVSPRVALLAAAGGLVAAAALAATAGAVPAVISQDQKIEVVVCKYKGTSDPVIDVDHWVRVLNAKVNDYYRAAAQNQTTFKFEAVPGTCDAGDYNGKSDDSFSVFNEGGAGILFADKVDNGFWGQPGHDRILVIVNKPKRARTLTGAPFGTGHSGIRQIGVVVYSETITQKDGTVLDRKGKVQDSDVSVIAHENGHLLGLPDLYKEGGGPGEYTELWDLMAQDNQQNFSAYSRWQMGWLAGHTEMLVPGANPGGSDRVISPPGSGGTEAIYAATQFGRFAIPAGSAPLQGHMIEARPGTGLDLKRKQLDESGGDAAILRCTGMSGLDGYSAGVLVSAVDAVPVHPVAVEGTRVSNGQTCQGGGELGSASLFWQCARDNNGNPFNCAGESLRTDDGLSVNVTGMDPPGSPPGSFKVHIDWNDPEARPDVAVGDAWLDSPANGFDSYFMPDNDNDGAPDLFGDPTYNPVSCSFTGGCSFGTATHRLHIKLENRGTVAASDVKGSAYLLGAEVPVGADLSDRDALKGVSFARREDISFGDVGVNQSVEKTIEVDPVGPFVLAVVLNKNANELDLANNARLEPFIVPQTGTGSPYKPVNLALDVANLNRTPRVIYVSPSSLPSGWKFKLGLRGKAKGGISERVYAGLNPGKGAKFGMLITPPSPSVAKPGQLQPITLTGFMNYGDSFAPVTRIPIQVSLANGTDLAISSKDASASAAADERKVAVSGTLRYHQGSTRKPVAGETVALNVVGSDGSELAGGPDHPELTAKTNANGGFSMTLTLKPGAKYGVVGQYGGSMRYAAARSKELKFE